MLVEHDTSMLPLLSPPASTRTPTAQPRARAPESLRARTGPTPTVRRRVVDFCLALVLLTCTWPVILAAALLIRLSSRGPAFYLQTRLGLYGRPFRIHKLRTMQHDCESQSGPRWSTNGDPRIVPLGRFLRRTHIDELPQLWNVLRGEMSLVGPRPERPEFVPQLERVVPCYRDRLLVLPGLTGLAQIHLPPDTDLASVRHKLAYDLYYVRQQSFWLDLRILAATGCRGFLPFTLLARLFGFPEREVVVETYEALAAGVL
jgi:lipopolysaccharide/colanic/teichoic acid biosynthesis glycosyltransferase